MKTKRAFVLAALGVALGSVLLFTPGAASKSHGRSYKLEGAWVGKVPGTPVTWSYCLVPDSSGRSASVSGSVQVPVPVSLLDPTKFTDLEYISPMVGQARMTGPDTFEATVVFYGMKAGTPFNQVVFIGLNNVQGRYTAPGRAVYTNHLEFYAPSADGDGDGLPDPGTVPEIAGAPTVSLETQVPIYPPYAP